MRNPINRTLNLSIGRVVELKTPMLMGKYTTKHVTIERRKGQYLTIRKTGYWPAPSKGYWNKELKREWLADLTARTWSSENDFFAEFAPEPGMYEYDNLIELEVVSVEKREVHALYVLKNDPLKMVHIHNMTLRHWYENFRHSYRKVKGKRKISTTMKKMKSSSLFTTFQVRLKKSAKGAGQFTQGKHYEVVGITYDKGSRQYMIRDDSGMLVKSLQNNFFLAKKESRGERERKSIAAR